MLDKKARGKLVSLRESAKLGLRNLCSRNRLDECHIYKESF